MAPDPQRSEQDQGRSQRALHPERRPGGPRIPTGGGQVAPQRRCAAPAQAGEQPEGTETHGDEIEPAHGHPLPLPRILPAAPGTLGLATERHRQGVPAADGQRLGAGQPLIMMHPSDDVATALRDLAVGERLEYGGGDRRGTVEVVQPIPFGHKVALHAIEAGAAVRKYGAIIGRATGSIEAGAHVHIHNLSGVRGRGDLAAGAGGGSSDAAGR